MTPGAYGLKPVAILPFRHLPSPIMTSKTNPPAAELGQTILQWQMPEYAHHDKGKTWYVVAGIAVLAVIAYGLIIAEYTMVIAFALLAGVYYLLHNEPPKTMSVAITTLGIVIDRDFYQFSDMESFWIVYQPPEVKILYLRPAKKLSSDIRLELMDQNPMIVRQLLQTQIKEVPGEGESFVDRMSRILKL